MLLSGIYPAYASDILYPQPSDKEVVTVDWIEEITRRIPPLKHSRQNRWPLVLWRVIPKDRITAEIAAQLSDRGIVPSLPLDPSAISAARNLQRSGTPVVLTAGIGAGSVWPYNLEHDSGKWAYRFGDGGSKTGQNHPVPTLFSGWAIAAGEIKKTLNAFKNEGIEVDAAWLDYEGLPVLADYNLAIESSNGSHWLPRAALKDRVSFANYTRQLWITLLSTYIAAPAREVYPLISVTNWVAVLSLPEFPAKSWLNDPLPLVGPTMFTATNPVAYGIDTAFNAAANWDTISTQRDVDRIYTEVLLRQVSADAYARDRIAPELESVVWVARWVRDDPNTSTPIMSRTAYREALRHLWLRGTDAMEIFAAVRKGFSEMAIGEVEDAAEVFNEALRYVDILESGEVMTYDYELNDTNVLWSGMRTGNRATIRTVSFSELDETIELQPWPGVFVQLPAPPNGATFSLERDSKGAKITRE